MENIGDWIYIVFLIIAGISGLFTSKDKKKSKRRSATLDQPNKDIISTERPNKEKGFWEILEEITNDSPSSTTSIPQTTQRQVKQRTKEKNYQPEPILEPIKEAKEGIKLQHLIETNTSDDETNMISIETFKNIDELKRAIVCSEILNRKY